MNVECNTDSLRVSSFIHCLTKQASICVYNRLRMCRAAGGHRHTRAAYDLILPRNGKVLQPMRQERGRAEDDLSSAIKVHVGPVHIFCVSNWRWLPFRVMYSHCSSDILLLWPHFPLGVWTCQCHVNGENHTDWKRSLRVHPHGYRFYRCLCMFSTQKQHFRSHKMVLYGNVSHSGSSFCIHNTTVMIQCGPQTPTQSSAAPVAAVVLWLLQRTLHSL